jgi:polar amino acid transport system substrate-binding protein
LTFVNLLLKIIYECLSLEVVVNYHFFRRKIMKKYIPLVFLLSLALLMTACGGSGGGSTNSSAGSAGRYEGFESTLYKVLNTGVIKIGVIGAFAPCSFTNANGEWDGFEVEVANRIANSLGAKLELIEVTSDTRISSIETGKCDVVMGNSTRTLARVQKVAFSDTLIVSSERLLVLSNSAITGLNSIQPGAKIGVCKGATCDQSILAKRKDVDIVYYTSPTDGVVAVKNGQCVAFAEDSNTLEYQALLTGGVKVVGDPLDTISYNAMMLPIADQIWINYINEFVYEFNVSGQNVELFKKYFGSEPFTNFVPQY